MDDAAGKPGPDPELGRHDDAVMAVAALPDGRLITGDADGRVVMWDPDEPKAGRSSSAAPTTR